MQLGDALEAAGADSDLPQLLTELEIEKFSGIAARKGGNVDDRFARTDVNLVEFESERHFGL